MLLDVCRNQALGLYYAATLPHRKQHMAKRAEQGLEPITVLFYHRVADEHPNAWTIGLKRFQEQIAWLMDRFNIVSLDEAQRRIGSGKNSVPTVAITFDDGYADNCKAALPWLLDQQVPFTYFVTSENVLTGEPFEHDVQAGQCLKPNTPQQIRDLADAGVEIGCHSRSHVDLGAVDDPAVLHEQIIGARWELEDTIDRPVRYFAFPFGLPENLSNAAFEMAFKSGIWGVCSGYGGYNVPGDNPFHIRRIHGDPEWNRFKNWLTVDPRKFNNPQDFCPGDYRTTF